MDKKIKFVWNGSFVGHHYHFEIDGVPQNIGTDPFSSDEEVIKAASIFLKEKFNYILKEEDVKWEWGGQL